jgi:hypothetical protein
MEDFHCLEHNLICSHMTTYSEPASHHDTIGFCTSAACLLPPVPKYCFSLIAENHWIMEKVIKKKRLTLSYNALNNAIQLIISLNLDVLNPTHTEINKRSYT